jgi:DNA-directed RNA polymerase subunit RPC12/RpoP
MNLPIRAEAAPRPSFAKMTEPPRRSVLHLKTPPRRTEAPSAETGWRCKPCGTAVEISGALGDADVVRCPGCNASLGLAGQFRSDPPQYQRVRARKIGV